MAFTNTYTKSVPEETTGPDEATPAPDVTALPKTGDSSSLPLWLALLAVSAAGVMGAGVYSKRRRSSR